MRLDIANLFACSPTGDGPFHRLFETTSGGYGVVLYKHSPLTPPL